MAVSLADIARHAGLSVAAVSKALRDKPDIALTTRKRIKELAGELNYSPNVAARMLATRKTMSIGLLVPYPQIPSVVDRIRGAEAAATKQGYTLSITFHDGSAEDELRHLETLQGRVDGLVITPSTPAPALRTRLRNLSVPYVCMSEPFPGLKHDFAGVDDAQGGRLAAEHLLDRVKAGKRRRPLPPRRKLFPVELVIRESSNFVVDPTRRRS